MDKPDLSFEIENYKIKELTSVNSEELQNLFENCNDYFQLIMNRNTQPSDSVFEFNHVPEGKTIEDKFLYGVFTNQKLIGVIDLIRNYPDEKTWFIGLLMFTPNESGQNLGKKVFDKLTEVLKYFGAQKLRISVVNQNTKALGFWKHLGFVENGIGYEGISDITFFDYSLSQF